MKSWSRLLDAESRRCYRWQALAAWQCLLCVCVCGTFRNSRKKCWSQLVCRAINVGDLFFFHPPNSVQVTSMVHWFFERQRYFSHLFTTSWTKVGWPKNHNSPTTNRPTEAVNSPTLRRGGLPYCSLWWMGSYRGVLYDTAQDRKDLDLEFLSHRVLGGVWTHVILTSESQAQSSQPPKPSQPCQTPTLRLVWHLRVSGPPFRP